MNQNAKIAQALKILKRGETVAIPTETVYGLAADATNEEAIARIFEIKGRPAFDPLIAHFYQAQDLKDYVESLPPIFHQLYQVFCPGPLTFILNKTSKVPDILTAGHPTVAVRFPAHPLTRNLLKAFGKPLAAPSANLFGRVSPTTAQHVQAQLGKNVALILDGGACEVGLESTIIDLTANTPRILRLGGVSLENLEKILGHKLTVNAHSSSNPSAPGMLSVHYSPGIKILHGRVLENLKLVDFRRSGSISFCQKIGKIPEERQRVLSPRCDLREAAANLFAALRSFNPKEVDVILAEEFPEEGLGRAINDRLRRAAQA